MAEVAPAPAAAPAKPVKKKAPKPRRATGPSAAELILKAVAASNDRKGVSLSSLKKSLAAGGYDVDKNKNRLKVTVRNLVAKGTLVQTKGIGASGSFKMSKEPKVKKPAIRKPSAKKPVAKKQKKAPAVKKPTVGKKSPKKAKKPAAAKKAGKSPKKVRPKKAAKKPAKSPKKPAAKQPKAKKTPVKKAPKAAAKKKTAPKKK